MEDSLAIIISSAPTWLKQLLDQELSFNFSFNQHFFKKHKHRTHALERLLIAMTLLLTELLSAVRMDQILGKKINTLLVQS
jgi:hypothetical protein